MWRWKRSYVITWRKELKKCLKRDGRVGEIASDKIIETLQKLINIYERKSSGDVINLGWSKQKQKAMIDSSKTNKYAAIILQCIIAEIKLHKSKKAFVKDWRKEFKSKLPEKDKVVAGRAVGKLIGDLGRVASQYEKTVPRYMVELRDDLHRYKDVTDNFKANIISSDYIIYIAHELSGLDI